MEFVASVYKVFLPKDQIAAVEAYMRGVSESDSAALRALQAEQLVANALASGEVNSVRAALRKKNVELPVRKALQQIQLSQRRVRGSEAEKDDLLPMFGALRLWSGCSSLFFTLNPHDIRSIVTLVLLQGGGRVEHQFSLDMRDAETDAYVRDFLMGQSAEVA